MPLGLAKDSMINLAEMAAEQSDKNVVVEGEEDEELVMQVATHNIAKDRASFVVTNSNNHNISSSSEDPNAAPLLGEFARDSLGQFTAEDDSNDLKDLADLEQLVRAQEAEQAAAAAAAAGGAGDISRTSSTASDDAAQQFVANMEEQEQQQQSQQQQQQQPQNQQQQQQQAEEGESSSSSSYGKYAGFSADYPEYDTYGDPAQYTAYEFKRTSVIDINGGPGGKKQSEGGLLCCLFPWFGGPSNEELEYQKWKDNYSGVPDASAATLAAVAGEPPARTMSKDDDEVSTESRLLGEKLSEKDRQAVLARLRLAQPDPAGSPAAASDPTDEANKNSKEKGLLNGIVPPTGGQQLKSILRRPSTYNNLNNNNNNKKDGGAGGDKDGKKSQRRSLFPAYEAPKNAKKNLHVEFADMARVMTVKSHKEMESSEKADVWWQRSDYEEFRKTGRMIVRAMLEGGSEIWLATSQSWQMPNQARQTTLKNAISLSEQKKAFEKGDINAKKEYEAARDKWWHKFGHSRRGLEHIASIDEGRQRQGNVRIAIKAIIDEQRRQKAFRRDDPEKLRMVSIQHTSWARDLALAAGASDADVLRQNFNDSNRKSREFFLLKFSRTSSTPNNTSKVVPAFMRPAMSMSVGPNRLDVNTVSQIRYRQTQVKKANSAANNSSSNSSSSNASTKPSTASAKQAAADAKERSSMAKQAAGYAIGQEGLNISAVLTGMGALPSETATAGGP